MKSADRLLLQKGRICSYKYHCHCGSRSLMWVRSGMSAAMISGWSTF